MKVNHKIFPGTYNKKMPSLLEVVYCVAKKKRTLSGQKIKTWHYYDDYFTDDDGVIEWHDGEYHQKRKAQKASIKKRTFTHCLAFIKVLGLVHVRR